VRRSFEVFGVPFKPLVASSRVVNLQEDVALARTAAANKMDKLRRRFLTVIAEDGEPLSGRRQQALAPILTNLGIMPVLVFDFSGRIVRVQRENISRLRGDT